MNTAHTPNVESHQKLSDLNSRFVLVDELPWKPTPTKGIDIKVLLEDKSSGLLTVLFRWQPVISLDLH
jgi:hypothetical protein